MDEAKNAANELKDLIETGMNKNHMRYYFHFMGMIEVEPENYEKFLDLWKDADPGIAEVKDAKKRVTGLKNQ